VTGAGVKVEKKPGSVQSVHTVVGRLTEQEKQPGITILQAAQAVPAKLMKRGVIEAGSQSQLEPTQTKLGKGSTQVILSEQF
jgi:hypothetical protein